MKRLSITLVLVVLACGNLFPQTQPSLPQPLDSLIAHGIDLIMRQEYSAALEHFRSVSNQYPDSPEGFLFQAATLQTQAIDFREFQGKEQFDSLIAITRSIAERMVEEHPDSPWGHYYLGTALGMDSYDRIQRGEYFSGYFKGRSSVSEIEKALEIDSVFYDAYSVLGTYYYWKSRKTEFLDWLPFFRDERAKGIECLRIAIQKGMYQRFAAMSNLVWIYLDTQNYIEAEKLAREALQVYPNQRAFLHGLAGALMGQNRFSEAQRAYERQLQEIRAAISPNEYNEIGCRLNIVWMKRALKDTSQVREHLSFILSRQPQQFPSFLRQKVDEKFEYALQFQQELANGSFTSH